MTGKAWVDRCIAHNTSAHYHLLTFPSFLFLFTLSNRANITLAVSTIVAKIYLLIVSRKYESSSRNKENGTFLFFIFIFFVPQIFQQLFSIATVLCAVRSTTLLTWASTFVVLAQSSIGSLSFLLMGNRYSVRYFRLDFIVWLGCACLLFDKQDRDAWHRRGWPLMKLQREVPVVLSLEYIGDDPCWEFSMHLILHTLPSVGPAREHLKWKGRCVITNSYYRRASERKKPYACRSGTSRCSAGKGKRT